MKTSIHTLLALLAVALFSCTEEIDFDLNEQGFDRLVVEGFITDQTKAHRVRLSRTTSYYDAETPPAVSGAEVSISNGLMTWSLTESPAGSGLYYTPDDAAGTPGLDHQLTIVDGEETYTAVDFMNPVAPLDSLGISFEFFDEPFEDEEDGLIYEGFWLIDIWTTETPGVGDFYRWKTFINGVSDGDTTRFSSFSDDVLFDGTTLEGYGIEGYGQYDILVGDTITLEQHAITEGFYDMSVAVIEQTEFQGGLFDPPPANVPSNVSGMALGYFSASSVSERTIIVEE